MKTDNRPNSPDCVDCFRTVFEAIGRGGGGGEEIETTPGDYNKST